MKIIRFLIKSLRSDKPVSLSVEKFNAEYKEPVLEDQAFLKISGRDIPPIQFKTERGTYAVLLEPYAVTMHLPEVWALSPEGRYECVWRVAEMEFWIHPATDSKEKMLKICRSCITAYEKAHSNWTELKAEVHKLNP